MLRCLKGPPGQKKAFFRLAEDEPMPTDIFDLQVFPLSQSLALCAFCSIFLFFCSQIQVYLSPQGFLEREFFARSAAGANSPEGAGQRAGLPAWVLPSSPKLEM